MAVLLAAAFSPTPGVAARGGALTFTTPVRLVADAPVGTMLGNGEHQSSGEPSIKVDSKGTIYLAGTTTVGQAAPVWVSQNDGHSFDQLTTPGNFREHGPYGAEGDIAIDAHDRMYFSDTDALTIALSRWSPAVTAGEQPNWDYTLPQPNGVEPVDDRPWLAYGSDPDGTESIWLFVNHAAYVGIYRSTNGGLLWTQVLMTSGSLPNMIASPRSNSREAYLFGDCGELVSLCSQSTHDSGGTWKPATVAKVDAGRQIGSIMVADAVDAAGNVYGVWSEADFDDGTKGDTASDNGCDIYYAASTDGGNHWLPKQRIDGPRGCSAFPWITAGDAGRIAVAWYETTAQGPNENSVPKKAAWYLKTAVITGATSLHPNSEIGVADPKAVHLGHLDRYLWDFLQIATGPDGRFHIAYAQDTDAGSNGPAGTALDPVAPLGAEHAKDTMYVGQAGGPLLIAPKAAAQPAMPKPPAKPRVKPRVKGSLPGTGVGVGSGPFLLGLAVMLSLVRSVTSLRRQRSHGR